MLKIKLLQRQWILNWYENGIINEFTKMNRNTPWQNSEDARLDVESWIHTKKIGIGLLEMIDTRPC